MSAAICFWSSRKGAVGWDESADDSGVASTFNTPALPPPPMPTSDGREGNRVPISIPEQVLAHIKIKIKKVNKFQCVWTSKGTMSRQETSVWEPIVGAGAFRKKRATVSLEHYIETGYNSPERKERDGFTLEITKTQGTFVGAVVGYNMSWTNLCQDLLDSVLLGL